MPCVIENAKKYKVPVGYRKPVENLGKIDRVRIFDEESEELGGNTDFGMRRTKTP
jgi:hypothetical protein